MWFLTQIYDAKLVLISVIVSDKDGYDDRILKLK